MPDMKRFFVLVSALLALAGNLAAQTADDQYLRIYGVIQEAESLSREGRQGDALTKYIEARTTLQRFQRGYPEWTPEVVKFRLDYLGQRITELSATVQPGQPARTPDRPAQSQPERPEPNPLQQEVASLKEQIQQLDSDRSLLRAKLQEALSAQPAAIDPRELAKAEDRIKALQKEVDLLNVTVAEARKNSRPEDSGAVANAQRALDQATRQLADEQRKSAQLSQELQALQARFKDDGSNRQAQKLREENEKLKRQLANAGKKSGTKDPATLQKLTELQNEAAGLKARLQVMEAARVPYSEEELTLMRKPAPQLAMTTASLPAQARPAADTPAKPPQEIPPQMATLVAEARRDFNAGQYAQAEQKYRQVLGEVKDYPPVLADLATIQMQQNRLDEAEQSLKAAQEAGSENPYVLLVQGQLRFRQKRYDETIELLGRAAALQPRNADIQNLLGVALSEKGMRVPAEAALRKAVQLQPGHVDAHNNLAVVYAYQNPPMLELARWHYQKALSGGGSRNPKLEQLLGTQPSR